MTLIDGKAISEQVKQEIAAEVAEIVARGGKRDRKSTRLNSSHKHRSRMPSSA